jgi:CobQ-like glutamine amidotransferase family enzyme
VKIEIGQKTINDLNKYCENENIKIIERLAKENKEIKLKIQEVELHHRTTLDYFNA